MLPVRHTASSHKKCAIKGHITIPKKQVRCNNALVHQVAEEYGQQLRNYFVGRVRIESDADDLLQDLYFRILTYSKPDTIQSIKAFVFTIATNLLRDKSRRSYTKAAAKMDSIDDMDIPHDSADPARIIEGCEELVAAEKTIEELPENCNKAFTLHRLEGLSHKQVAERMRVSVSMVEKHMIMALKQLRGAAMAA